MEMTIPQMQVTATQTQPPGSLQGTKGAGNGAFQQTLVQQINRGSAETAVDARPAPLMALTSNGTAAEGTSPERTLSDLISIIDELIDRLEAPAAEGEQAEEESGPDIERLEDALAQLTALLAFLGAPLQQANPAAGSASGAESGPSELQAGGAAGVKSDLQHSLLRLQALLQQGVVKLVQSQDPVELAGRQLQALTAILESAPADAGSLMPKPAASSRQLFAAPHSQAGAGTLLQRLSQQAVHPAYITAAAEQRVDMTEVTVTVPAEPAAAPSSQTMGQNAEIFRLLPQPPTVAAPVTTSFVAADQFAQTMSGLIIRKFDMTTVNGVSEAKLMLFPEHLGQVDVRITMQNGVLTAIFQTDTALAKDMLDNQMTHLRAALQAQGLHVDKLEVSQGQSASYLFGQQSGQGSKQQHSSQRQSFQGESAAVDSRFEAEMIEQAAEQGLGYGRTVNIKA
ncbi:flagellar hook-length control protein FliK [Paenibacillus sp. N4]|uniref:flagellar hook-length control protein FliK n=1 Tax=Paenibacillus vietnamensis TaxID=2590547 RepID=UPI001CD110B7|nr:flagellar hook-length control protein FliK [Paenibacillus vietnamensis]MCA0754038.1 flagellar hook-length control protein FliK [Paenibacillus vietnamensis]